jgi:hypothetical protein
MNAKQRRIAASAQWISTRATVLLLMRRALAHELEDLLLEGSADDEPAHKNALPTPALDERR